MTGLGAIITEMQDRSRIFDIGALWETRRYCELFMQEAADALSENFEPNGDNNPEEARKILTGAMSAARTLREHLERTYDFTGGGHAHLLGDDE